LPASQIRHSFRQPNRATHSTRFDPLLPLAAFDSTPDSRNGDAVVQPLADWHRGGATICMATHDRRYLEYALPNFTLLDGRVQSD
jgi:putative ABC transport system ATP-binding protein